jgi:hypothetical protein
MSIFANDLGPDTKHWDESIPSPLLDLKAETFANPETSPVVANHKAADNGARWRLEMAFDASIDPADKLSVQKSSKGDTVGRAFSLLDPHAKIVGRVGITELAAEVSCLFGVVDHQPADRELQAVPFRRGIHTGIIAPSGLVYSTSQTLLGGVADICVLCFYRFQLGNDDGETNAHGIFESLSISVGPDPPGASGGSLHSSAAG